MRNTFFTKPVVVLWFFGCPLLCDPRQAWISAVCEHGIARPAGLRTDQAGVDKFLPCIKKLKELQAIQARMPGVRIPNCTADIQAQIDGYVADAVYEAFRSAAREVKYGGPESIAAAIKCLLENSPAKRALQTMWQCTIGAHGVQDTQQALLPGIFTELARATNCHTLTPDHPQISSDKHREYLRLGSSFRNLPMRMIGKLMQSWTSEQLCKLQDVLSISVVGNTSDKDRPHLVAWHFLNHVLQDKSPNGGSEDFINAAARAFGVLEGAEVAILPLLEAGAEHIMQCLASRGVPIDETVRACVSEHLGAMQLQEIVSTLCACHWCMDKITQEPHEEDNSDEADAKPGSAKAGQMRFNQHKYNTLNKWISDQYACKIRERYLAARVPQDVTQPICTPEKVLHTELVRNAIKLQSLIRGYLVRSRAKQAVRNLAVTKIQNAWQMRLAHKLLQSMEGGCESAAKPDRSPDNPVNRVNKEDEDAACYPPRTSHNSGPPSTTPRCVQNRVLSLNLRAVEACAILPPVKVKIGGSVPSCPALIVTPQESTAKPKPIVIAIIPNKKTSKTGDATVSWVHKTKTTMLPTSNIPTSLWPKSPLPSLCFTQSPFTRPESHLTIGGLPPVPDTGLQRFSGLAGNNSTVTVYASPKDIKCGDATNTDHLYAGVQYQSNTDCLQVRHYQRNTDHLHKHQPNTASKHGILQSVLGMLFACLVCLVLLLLNLSRGKLV